MGPFRRFSCFSLSFSWFCFLLWSSGSDAWWVKGHGLIAEAAASRLPTDMPRFFVSSGKSLSHLAGDPDRWKNRDTTFLNKTEYSEHFLDLEDLDGHEWPSDRFKYIELCQKLNKKPNQVGFIPYTLMDYYEKLALAFADHRKDPENEAIRMKCIVFAGCLAHYTGDVCMPLHTTRDYDGRKGPNGQMLQKGIHAKIDGFPETHGFTAEEIARALEPRKVEDFWKHVQKTFMDSHAQIERCYELDMEKAFDKPTAASRAFIMQRCQASAQFTLDAWYNAWLRSAQLTPAY